MLRNFGAQIGYYTGINYWVRDSTSQQASPVKPQTPNSGSDSKRPTDIRLEGRAIKKAKVETLLEESPNSSTGSCSGNSLHLDEMFEVEPGSSSESKDVETPESQSRPMKKTTKHLSKKTSPKESSSKEADIQKWLENVPVFDQNRTKLWETINAFYNSDAGKKLPEIPKRNYLVDSKVVDTLAKKAYDVAYLIEAPKRMTEYVSSLSPVSCYKLWGNMKSIDLDLCRECTNEEDVTDFKRLMDLVENRVSAEEITEECMETKSVLQSPSEASSSEEYLPRRKTFFVKIPSPYQD